MLRDPRPTTLSKGGRPARARSALRAARPLRRSRRDVRAERLGGRADAGHLRRPRGGLPRARARRPGRRRAGAGPSPGRAAGATQHGQRHRYAPPGQPATATLPRPSRPAASAPSATGAAATRAAPRPRRRQPRVTRREAAGAGTTLGQLQRSVAPFLEGQAGRRTLVASTVLLPIVLGLGIFAAVVLTSTRPRAAEPAPARPPRRSPRWRRRRAARRAAPAPAVPAALAQPPAPARLVVNNVGPDGALAAAHPGHDGQRIKVWNDGTEMADLGETAEHGGKSWRKVRDPDGNVGWVAAEFLADPAARAHAAAPAGLAFASGGLGLPPRRVGEGPRTADPQSSIFLEYDGGRLVVGLLEGNVWHIERVWMRGEAVSLDAARERRPRLPARGRHAGPVGRSRRRQDHRRLQQRDADQPIRAHRLERRQGRHVLDPVPVPHAGRPDGDLGDVPPGRRSSSRAPRVQMAARAPDARHASWIDGRAGDDPAEACAGREQRPDPGRTLAIFPAARPPPCLRDRPRRRPFDGHRSSPATRARVRRPRPRRGRGSERSAGRSAWTRSCSGTAGALACSLTARTSHCTASVSEPDTARRSPLALRRRCRVGHASMRERAGIRSRRRRLDPDGPAFVGAQVGGVHHRLDAQPLPEVGEVRRLAAAHPRHQPVGKLHERPEARIAGDLAHQAARDLGRLPATLRRRRQQPLVLLDRQGAVRCRTPPAAGARAGRRRSDPRVQRAPLANRSSSATSSSAVTSPQPLPSGIGRCGTNVPSWARDLVDVAEPPEQRVDQVRAERPEDAAALASARTTSSRPGCSARPASPAASPSGSRAARPGARRRSAPSAARGPGGSGTRGPRRGPARTARPPGPSRRPRPRSWRTASRRRRGARARSSPAPSRGAGTAASRC